MATAARYSVVDLLQRDDVGAFGFTDLSNALGSKLAVDTDRFVNVIRENRDLQGTLRGIWQVLTFGYAVTEISFAEFFFELLKSALDRLIIAELNVKKLTNSKVD